MSRNRVATIAIVAGLAVLAIVATVLSLVSPEPTSPEPDAEHPEVHRILPVLRAAQDAFHKGLGAYEVMEACPPGDPGPEAVPLGSECTRYWAGLGVEDPGPLVCRYKSYEDGRVQASCDLDGDGVIAIYTLAPAGEIERVTPPMAH